MKLEFTITVDEGGIGCRCHVDGEDAYETVRANMIAIGALEVAKASLLARRWGLNVADMQAKPLVGKPEVEAP